MKQEFKFRRWTGEEVKTLANWLDEFLYSTRENGTPALTEKTQQRKVREV